jgi:hypothetical protein
MASTQELRTEILIPQLLSFPVIVMEVSTDRKPHFGTELSHLYVATWAWLLLWRNATYIHSLEFNSVGFDEKLFCFIFKTLAMVWCMVTTQPLQQPFLDMYYFVQSAKSSCVILIINCTFVLILFISGLTSSRIVTRFTWIGKKLRAFTSGAARKTQ